MAWDPQGKSLSCYESPEDAALKKSQKRLRLLQNNVPLEEDFPVQDSTNLETGHPPNHTHSDRASSGERDVLSALDEYLELQLKPDLSQSRGSGPGETKKCFHS